MNGFIRALAECCRARLLEEKWIVAPSLRIGHQWLDAVARAGQPVVHARITTLKGLALELAAPTMAETGTSLASSQGAAILIDAILNRPAQGGAGYLSSLQPSPSLSQTIFAALDAIRLAGIKAEDLRPGIFEVDGKAQDLARLLREYLQRLEELHLVDYAAVLAWAVSRLSDDASALAHGTLVVFPEDMDLAPLERALIDAIPAERRCKIPVDRPLVLPDDADDGPCDILLLRWLASPADAPAPKQDGSAQIFRAVGEVNEVREVLRRVLAMQRPLDEVEVLHTDTETYVPLLLELAWRLQPEADGAERGPPITFAEGVSARYSRPGRALLAWLGWIRDGYPQGTLVRMVQDGLIDLAERGQGEYTFSGLAALLRSVGIGFGRERHLRKLSDEIAGCQRQMRGVPEPESLPQPRPLSRERESRRLEGLKLLYDLVEGLLAMSPRAEAAPSDVLDAAVRFLEQRARSVNELDNFARLALVDQIRRMQHWLRQAGAPLSHDVWDWLVSLAGQVRVAGSGPRPGCLHVAHVQSGGHSGRPVAFVVGLDDSRFPGAGLQDPLLLDHERRELSSELTTAAGQLKDRLDDFTRLLARLRGRVTLSYCCHDLVDDREMFPSPAVLSAYRILSGKRDGDQSDLLAWLPAPASFAPSDAGACLDESQWWMWRLCGPEPVEKVADLVAEHFPHLGRGRQSAAARSGCQFSCFDGLVPEAGRRVDPTKPGGLVLSASGLEMIGRCPLSFFFRYVLGIEPLEELQIDPNVWLSPPEFGSLLHEVFRRFLSRLRAAGLLPDLARDMAALTADLEQENAAWRALKPPPSESVFRAQDRQLREAVRIFLAGEEDLCRQYRPEYMEPSLGMASAMEPTPLDELRPIPVKLPGGGEILARGRIDRVDRLGPNLPHQYAVWDYKTGSASKFRNAESYATGRVVQPTLYQAMVQTALRRKIDPEATVTQFGYCFPTAQGQGDRICRCQDDLDAGTAVLERLCRIVAGGAFLATDDPDDCLYCNYRSACRNIEATTGRSQIKLQRSDNALLQPMRELRMDE